MTRAPRTAPAARTTPTASRPTGARRARHGGASGPGPRRRAALRRHHLAARAKTFLVSSTHGPFRYRRCGPTLIGRITTARRGAATSAPCSMTGRGGRTTTEGTHAMTDGRHEVRRGLPELRLAPTARAADDTAGSPSLRWTREAPMQRLTSSSAMDHYREAANAAWVAAGYPEDELAQDGVIETWRAVGLDYRRTLAAVARKYGTDGAATRVAEGVTAATSRLRRAA
jgi:hypothetical protein